jgi:hypothetical protein
MQDFYFYYRHEPANLAPAYYRVRIVTRINTDFVLIEGGPDDRLKCVHVDTLNRQADVDQKVSRRLAREFVGDLNSITDITDWMESQIQRNIPALLVVLPHIEAAIESAWELRLEDEAQALGKQLDDWAVALGHHLWLYDKLVSLSNETRNWKYEHCDPVWMDAVERSMWGWV